MLEGLPQQKDLSRVLYLPPPPGGHIRACVGWFVCCLFSFVCRNGRATTGEHRGFCPSVIYWLVCSGSFPLAIIVITYVMYVANELSVCVCVTVSEGVYWGSAYLSAAF